MYELYISGAGRHTQVILDLRAFKRVCLFLFCCSATHGQCDAGYTVSFPAYDAILIAPIYEGMARPSCRVASATPDIRLVIFPAYAAILLAPTQEGMARLSWPTWPVTQ